MGQSEDKYEGGQGKLTREQQQAERIGLGGVRKEEEEPDGNSERNRGDLNREQPTHRDDTGPGKSAGL